MFAVSELLLSQLTAPFLCHSLSPASKWWWSEKKRPVTMSGASVGVSVQTTLRCWFTVWGSRPGAHLPAATSWGEGTYGRGQG